MGPWEGRRVTNQIPVWEGALHGCVQSGPMQVMAAGGGALRRGGVTKISDWSWRYPDTSSFFKYFLKSPCAVRNTFECHNPVCILIHVQLYRHMCTCTHTPHPPTVSWGWRSMAPPCSPPHPGKEASRAVLSQTADVFCAAVSSTPPLTEGLKLFSRFYWMFMEEKAKLRGCLVIS